MSRFALMRSKQPQQSSAIEWSNPICRGLVVAILPWSNTNLALVGSKAAPSSAGSGVTRGLGYAGVAKQYDGVDSSGYLLYNWPTTTGDLTLLTFLNIDSGSGIALLGLYNSLSATQYNALFLDTGASKFHLQTLVSSDWTSATAVNTYTAGKDYLVAGRVWNGAGRDIWVNGVLEATDSTARTQTALDTVAISAYYPNSPPRFAFKGRKYVELIWSRALSDAEMQSITHNPWQVFTAIPKRQRIIPSSGNTYTITPSGSIAFSGAVPLLRTRLQVPSGGIVFSGAVPLLRTRLQPVSGQVTFSGTAPITYVPFSGNIYTITPSGGITFSGAVPQLRTRVQVPSGSISFSGSATLLRIRALVPSGSIAFSGTVPLVRTRIQVPSGTLVFSGGASISFIPAGSATAVALNRISIGVDRAGRLS